MRVLMLNYEYPPVGGGAATATKYFLDEVATREDVTVDLLTSSPDAYEETSLDGGVRIYKFDVNKRDLHYWRAPELLRWSVKAYRKAGELLEEHDYDLCHAWFGWPSGLIAYRYRNECPYLVGLRGSDIPGYNPRIAWLDSLVFTPLSRLVWKNASAITVLSEDSASMARETLDTEFEVIYNGVDTDTFTPAVTDSPNPVTFLFVGRLIERKGVDTLIQAFDMVKQRHPDTPFTLSIVGDGNLSEDLDTMVEERGLEDSVKLYGAMPHEDLPGIYRSHDVFVLPSMNEALSNVVLEAIASGLAIISTETGAAEMVDENGIVIPESEPEPLAEAMERYVEHPSRVGEHGRTSAAKATEINWSAFTDAYLDRYREIAGESR